MDRDLQIRKAGPGDEASIVALIQALAADGDWTSPLTEDGARAYLQAPGCEALLAEQEGRACGLLSYTVRPNLFHAGDTAYIEELVVNEAHRGRGVGHALMDDFFDIARARGWVEVSVATLFENEGARRFYRAHGFEDEALLLEKHLA
jgi:ribosomal protein S18 acetylase RimI-like enzyme